MSNFGCLDGPGTLATFRFPISVAMDREGTFAVVVSFLPFDYAASFVWRELHVFSARVLTGSACLGGALCFL